MNKTHLFFGILTHRKQHSVVLVIEYVAITLMFALMAKATEFDRLLMALFTKQHAARAVKRKASCKRAEFSFGERFTKCENASRGVCAPYFLRGASATV